MTTWQFATPEEFIPICEMFRESPLGAGRGFPDIQCRITIPILLKQLITFYKNDKLCGFITYGLLDENAERNLATVGIMPSDWRSGDNFWAIDLVSKEDSYKFLRTVIRALGVKKCKYFRHKQQRVKELRSI